LKRQREGGKKIPSITTMHISQRRKERSSSNLGSKKKKKKKGIRLLSYTAVILQTRERRARESPKGREKGKGKHRCFADLVQKRKKEGEESRYSKEKKGKGRPASFRTCGRSEKRKVKKNNFGEKKKKNHNQGRRRKRRKFYRPGKKEEEGISILFLTKKGSCLGQERKDISWPNHIFLLKGGEKKRGRKDPLRKKEKEKKGNLPIPILSIESEGEGEEKEKNEWVGKREKKRRNPLNHQTKTTQKREERKGPNQEGKGLQTRSRPRTEGKKRTLRLRCYTEEERRKRCACQRFSTPREPEKRKEKKGGGWFRKGEEKRKKLLHLFAGRRGERGGRNQEGKRDESAFLSIFRGREEPIKGGGGGDDSPLKKGGGEGPEDQEKERRINFGFFSNIF